MIVDSSAIMAVLREEPRAAECLSHIARSSDARLSAGTLVELSVVVLRSGGLITIDDLNRFIGEFEIKVEPVTEYHARISQVAYEQYGRGSGHAARLNFGDCFSYALARERNEPLLFVGDDFTHTDIIPALPPAQSTTPDE